ncbi:MAG: MATE family efflux transporter [Clostridia bacterium]|nr:MATE family efflux transporter [Clostridia bacterium]
MSKKYDLTNDSVVKIFIHYFIMSAAGLMVLSIHIILDGIFIGHGIGSDGLAAINIAGVVFPFLNAISFTIGFGAAAAVSVKFGEGESQKANNIFNQAFMLSIIVSLVYTVLSIIFIDQLVYLLGSNEQLFQGSKDYLFVFSLFSIFYIITIVFENAVRNDGEPKKAMISLILGAVTNTVLNYVFIFIFSWGLKGAALATGIGQIVSCVYLTSHFLFQKGQLYFQRTGFFKQDIIRIVRNGVPNGLSQLSVTLVIITGNWIVIDMLGELGVAAFGILIYINEFVILGFAGVAGALQPLVSFNFGAKKKERIQKIVQLAFYATLLIGITVIIVSIKEADIIIRLFNNEEELVSLTSHAMKLFFLGIVFTGLNMLYSAYFQAVEKAKESAIIQVLRGFVFIFIALFTLPKIYDVDGLWISPSIAEVLTFAISIILVKTRPILKKNEVIKDN